MAHKCLKGKRKATKSTLKESLKASQKKDRAKQAAKAEKPENPEHGLRKWQKKALRAGKPIETESEEEQGPAKKARVDPKAKAAEAPQAPTPAPAEASSVAEPSGPGKKIAKRELRLKLAQEKQHLGLYSDKEQILLVGEGNFSFARALCRQLKSGKGVYATAFDNEAALNRKYLDAADCRKEIEEQFGGTTLVGVDASKIHKVKEFRGSFRKIVWNFPHIGSGETDVEKSIENHRKLLAGFFASAVQCLDPAQECHIHLAIKGGEPYKSWKVMQIAKAAAPELVLENAVSFALGAWPGYAHRRTIGFNEKFSKKDSEELAKGAKVYIFVRPKAEAESADEGDEGSEE